MKRFFTTFLLLFLIFAKAGYMMTLNLPEDSLTGKKPDTTTVKPEPLHLNVLKFNPTPMLLWSNVWNITFSYERMIRKDMSLCFLAGYLLLPRVLTDTVAGLVTITGGKKYGINLAFDYRYYPFARNRRPAPDGLYLGGFLSYYGFNFSNNLDILHTDLDQNASIKGKLNVVNLGVNLGYQFIFWKRFSVDLLMFGPSLSYYSGAVGFNGDFDPGEIEEIDEDLVNAILEKWPWLGTLFTAQSLEFTGSKTKISFGFRYSIQLGYHF